MPAVGQLGHQFRAYVLRRDDGAEVTVVIADSEQLYPVIEVHDAGPVSEDKLHPRG